MLSTALAAPAARCFLRARTPSYTSAQPLRLASKPVTLLRPFALASASLLSNFRLFQLGPSQHIHLLKTLIKQNPPSTAHLTPCALAHLATIHPFLALLSHHFLLCPHHPPETPLHNDLTASPTDTGWFSSWTYYTACEDIFSPATMMPPSFQFCFSVFTTDH